MKSSAWVIPALLATSLVPFNIATAQDYSSSLSEATHRMCEAQSRISESIIEYRKAGLPLHRAIEDGEDPIMRAMKIVIYELPSSDLRDPSRLKQGFYISCRVQAELENMY